VELMLIRHGLPVRRELDTGRADPELSEAGQAQAHHLAAYLSTERIDAVYSSPLRRALETAAPGKPWRHRRDLAVFRTSAPSTRRG
jgi:probable phosphoglycerate mutase